MYKQWPNNSSMTSEETRALETIQMNDMAL